MFKVRGTVSVDVAGFRLSDVAGSSIGTPDLPSLLQDVVQGLAELPAESLQEHGLVAAEDRKLELAQQISQPPRRQAEEIVEES